ncbi:MAG: hypothetical protein V9821_00100 [Candidatus Dasytiphilus stammeri]
MFPFLRGGYALLISLFIRLFVCIIAGLETISEFLMTRFISLILPPTCHGFSYHYSFFRRIDSAALREKQEGIARRSVMIVWIAEPPPNELLIA